MISKSPITIVIGCLFLLAIPGGVFSMRQAVDLEDYRMVFASSCNDEQIQRIYTIQLDGTSLSRVTAVSGQARESNPNLSPDGTRLVFTSSLGQVQDSVSRSSEFDSALYVARLDDGIPWQLTPFEFAAFFPIWVSNDTIAFDSYYQNLFLVLHTINLTDPTLQPTMFEADGFNISLFSETGESNGPDGVLEWAWSPDGSRVAFAGQRDEVLYVANHDGSDLTALVNASVLEENPNRVEGYPSLVNTISWSHDGQEIMFGLGNWRYDSSQWYYIVGANGEGLRRAPQPFGVGIPIRSPSGEWFVFDQGYNIYLMTADTDTIDPFRVSISGRIEGWLPDRDILLLSQRDDGSSDCGEVSVSTISLLDIACVDTPDGCGEEDLVRVPNARLTEDVDLDIVRLQD